MFARLKELFGISRAVLAETREQEQPATNISLEIKRLQATAERSEQEQDWLQAATMYRRLLELEPDNIRWRKDLGFVLSEEQDWEQSIAAYQQVIEALPDDANAHYNIGRMYAEQVQLNAAEKFLQQALDLNPGHAQAAMYLGIVKQRRKDFAASIPHFQRSVEIDPGFNFGYFNMAVSQVALGDLAGATESLRTCSGILHDGEPAQDMAMPPHKFLHDLEQFEFLAQEDGERWQAIADDWRQVYDNAGLDSYQDKPEWVDAMIPIDESMPARVRETAYRPLLRHEEPRVEYALNPDLDFAALEAQFIDGPLPAVAIDNVLTEEALRGLQRFCQRNTFWYDSKQGYLGAYLQDGFYCDLLLQLATELRSRFPRIFEHHHWRNMWGFKHDRNHGGIAIHADTAAVNVNYWLTPDSANLLPDKGGLLVWDKEAPPDWNFRKTNTDAEAIDKFLQASRAKPVCFPFRENRALIFRSTLFHRTDEVSFKPGYENRRLNVTMLYGEREDAHL